MGLIKAAAGAFGGTMADQWKEFFYCDAIDKDVLVVKGEKRVGGRSSNKKGSDNIISSGSGIAVADGQCMIIVEQGKVVEVCAEPGQFTYDASTEPSIFAGSLGEGIHRTFDTVKKRFTFGGDTGKDQRVYYFNTKELVDNKFGTANPIPFRVVDRNIGLDIDVSVRCNGVYSYKIVDPLLFYTNVCGNVEQQYDREEIEVQLKTEFVSALQPAFAKISELQIRPSAIPGHVLELCDAMNEALTKKWQQTRGLAVVSIAMNPVTLPEEDAQLIKDAQKNAILRDPTMAAATLAGAQADAMKSAASNTAGAMTGFMGMGMAMNAGGMNPENLYAMGQQQAAQKWQQQKEQVSSQQKLVQHLRETVKDKPAYDLQTAEQTLEQKRSEKERTEKRCRQSSQQAQQCKTIAGEVQKRYRSWESEARQGNTLEKLYQMMTGTLKKGERISFERYVQTYYFNRVLQFANQKLYQLSNGRYQFRRRQEETVHNISSGLNLDVLEQYTGKSRSVETLSGGETFLASLALALGLSDTVQQQSGGIQLNAMFIDEGFGSLDSTALDNAVQVLQQLSDHQRTIGIISHVSELAERFEAQLQVEKSENGSHVICHYE